jgi:thiol-disulfide isomerase/thioredoxin
MKTSIFLSCLQTRFTGFLACLFVSLLLPSADGAAPIMGTNGDFSAVSRAVIELLQSHDAARFARELAPDLTDYRAILSTNLPARGDDPLKGFQSSAGSERQKVELSAKALLARADSLHLDFSNVTFQVRIVPPKYLGTTRFNNLQAGDETIPWAEKVEVVLVPDSGTHHLAEGEFKIAVRGLMEFPGGWRSYEGVQWAGFPPNVADEKTLRELVILNKAATYQGITDQDDPALLKLGRILVRFVRERDVNRYRQDALVSADLVWAQFQTQRPPGKGPSRQEFDQMWNEHQKDLLDPARATTGLMDKDGIDFKNATIQVEQVSVKQLYPRLGAGSVDGLEGNQFQIKFAVESAAQSATGESLSGDYTLAADQITRFGDDWKVTGKLRWDTLPHGVVDGKTAAALELENYVAEHRALPPGSLAPDIEFITLDGGKQMKLSDLRGKVVVLDFWATWCGPCQEPMAKLQTLRQEHPDWKDRVALVPLSIDDTIPVLRDHLEKRGWTNTFNVWAGEGGWHSAPAATFRVTGVPTTYIINSHGTIVKAGHPATMNIGDEVDTQLKLAKE